MRPRVVKQRIVTLTEEDVGLILQLAGQISVKSIAEKFEVTPGYIYCLCSRHEVSTVIRLKEPIKKALAADRAKGMKYKDLADKYSLSLNKVYRELNYKP